jgi:TolB-like protein
MNVFPDTLRKALMLCLFVLTLSACGLKDPHFQKLSELPAGSLCRVAVLPFSNETDFWIGNQMFPRIFSSEMMRIGNFQVSVEGDVRNVYRQLRAVPGQNLDMEQVRILADQLDVDFVVSGTLITMKEDRYGNNANPVLAVSIEILDADSGRVLWKTYHRREGREYRKAMHFGVVNTMTSLSRLVSEEIITYWINSGGMQKCSE